MVRERFMNDFFTMIDAAELIELLLESFLIISVIRFEGIN